MIFERIASRSASGTPAELSAAAKQTRECSKEMVCPQDGQFAQPWMSWRRPSREVEESRRANRSTRMEPPAALSRFVSGTRTGVLQMGQRAGLRQVQTIQREKLLAADRKKPAAHCVATFICLPADVAWMNGTPVEAAAELRDELLEILRQLNRAEMEEPGDEGLELDELHHLLARQKYPQLTTDDVARAVRVLVGNGYARLRDDPEYAWDRGRVMGRRFTITTEGKAFLVERLVRTNRVE